MKVSNIIILCFFVTSLVGCSKSFYDEQMSIAKSEKEKHPEVKVFDGEEEPPFPDLNKNNSTINGIDINKNGIRDDVEIWINRTYGDKTLREQTKKYARAYLTEIRISNDGDVMELIDSSKRSQDRIDLELSEKQIKQTIGCMVYLKYPKEEVLSDRAIKMIFNTKARQGLDMKIGQIVSAIHFPINPKKEDCE